MIVMLGISINNQVDEAQTKAEVQKIKGFG